uniref:Solute carrier family 15 member 1 n=1 Tax=Salmo trutta TaxID=8032 RepID=A0A674DCZ6_SALTR
MDILSGSVVVLFSSLAVLVLYFRYFLKWDDDLSTSIYHTFIALCYLTPILGAIVADSWLGKFKTIVYLSIVYTVGQVVMGSKRPCLWFGLFLIALGTGGIKPCVAAFGGDQLKTTRLEKQRSTFFSIFYLSINAGSLLSTVITPILRGTSCGIHSQQKCYPLAFGVPAALMGGSQLMRMYNKTAPKGNIMLRGLQFAVKNRFRQRSKKFPKREHWMDWADEKYDKLLVAQVKMVLKVLFLYIPLPMFWTLFDQQGSRWTLQATTMDGNFVRTVNPILILALVPIMDSLVYPLIKKCHLNFTPLKRMTVGMLIAALAFVAAALLQLQIDVSTKTLPKLPQGVAGQVKFLNLDSAPLTLTIDGTIDVSVPAHQVNTGDYLTFDKSVRVTRRTALVSPTLGYEPGEFVNGLGSALNITLGVGDIAPLAVSNYSLVPQGKAEFTIMNSGGASCLYSKELGFGSAFTLVIPSTFTIGSPDCWQAIQVVVDIQPNTIHMGWQIPQYFLMTAGEVVFSVTGLEFSYSQAPSNMKSVLQAGWLFTVAVGNIIVLIVAEAAQLPDQWAEYILFASLLVVVCIVFAIMSYFYTYTDPAEIEAEFRQPEHEPEEKKKRDQVEMERKDSDCSKSSKGSDKKKKDSVVEQLNQEVKQSKM